MATYSEGDWFAVPVDGFGYSLGLVARSEGRGVVLAYFMGQRLDGLPTIFDAQRFKASDAILVGLVSHLSLQNGRWPLIGRLPQWDRTHWPMPFFRRSEAITGRTLRITRSEDDPGVTLREEPVAESEVDGLPIDRIMGAQAAESRLAAAMSSRPS